MIKLFNIMFFRLFTFLFTFSFAFGQSLSGEIKNLSNSDLDLIRSKLLSNQVNQIDIEKADKVRLMKILIMLPSKATIRPVMKII